MTSESDAKYDPAHPSFVNTTEGKRVAGLTNKENPCCARVCFLIDPQINPSTHSLRLHTLGTSTLGTSSG